MLISTATFKKAQLSKNGRVLTWIHPRARTRLCVIVFFVSIIFSMLFTQLCSRHVLQAPVLSLGQRLTCLNDHFKYFPECFHTLAWLRWDFNYQRLEKHSRDCSGFPLGWTRVTTRSVRIGSTDLGLSRYITLQVATYSDCAHLCTAIVSRIITFGQGFGIFKYLCLLTL